MSVGTCGSVHLVQCDYFQVCERKSKKGKEDGWGCGWGWGAAEILRHHKIVAVHFKEALFFKEKAIHLSAYSLVRRVDRDMSTLL